MSKIKLTFFLLVPIYLSAGDIDKRLQEYIMENPHQNINVWIYLADKGIHQNLNDLNARDFISEKAIKRRLKMHNNTVLDQTDFPLNDAYVKQIEKHVVKIRKKSRWLNAVSVEVAIKNIKLIASLSFVKKVSYLNTYKREVPELTNGQGIALDKTIKINDLDYGLSENQIRQINVDSLHNLGLSGSGVTIAVFDNGFNLFDTHEAFESLDVIGTYDFTRDTTYVYDPQGGHGTNVLSALAGYFPGQLIGPAYGASFLLALTEINSSETIIEEDHWVAGVEWADSSGADIVSSSLGYIDWYTPEQLDGETAITTQITNYAETKGIIVVNSAGNEGGRGLIAPADGKYVITVGGVYGNGDNWSTSSQGPTWDGRIKPDVVAQGVSVRLASSSNTQGYINANGTSFSTPLVAGAVALILEEFPSAKPSQIRSAIKYTASHAESPDNFTGWGILDIKAAYDCFEESDTLCLGDTLTRLDTIDTGVYQSKLAINYPNPFSNFTSVLLSENSKVEITIFDVLGRKVHKITKSEPAVIYSHNLEASGIYFYTVKGIDGSGAKINKRGKLIYLAD